MKRPELNLGPYGPGLFWAVSLVESEANGTIPGGRIAFLLPDLSGGGAERVALDLARGFMDRGFDCELVLYANSGDYSGQIPRGLEVADLRASRTASALLPLVGYLRRKKPLALISSLIHTNIIASWAASLARTRPRLILTVHNMTSVELADHERSLLARVTPWLMKRSYPRADHMVAVSQGVARDLEEVTGIRPGTVRTVYNPCDLDKVVRGAGEELDHPWFSPGQPPVILALGRLVPQKDFTTLLRAVALLRRERRVRLMILGQGPDQEALETLGLELGLDGDLALPGFVDNPYPYLARASLLALSSAFEGFGLVLVEAMALGTPVTATDCPHGPAEILDRGRFGELVPVGHEQALALALARTLDQPLPAEKLIQRAGEFSLERAVDNYLALVRSPGKRP